MLAAIAVLFVLCTAIVTFQGWPRIATQGSAGGQVTGAPVYRSPVSHRLRVATTATPAPRVARHAGRRGRNRALRAPRS